MSDWQVKPVASYYGKYKDARRVIIEAIQRRDDLTIPQKLALLESETNKQKAIFRTERRSEFESKSVAVTIEHSCTSSASGGTKNCGWRCATSPSPAELHTKPEWVTTSGTNKGLSVSGDQACIKMTVSGSGRNAGSVTATFRYKPEVVNNRMQADIETLFNLIADDGVGVDDFVDERIGLVGNSIVSLDEDA